MSSAGTTGGSDPTPAWDPRRDPDDAAPGDGAERTRQDEAPSWSPTGPQPTSEGAPRDEPPSWSPQDAPSWGSTPAPPAPPAPPSWSPPGGSQSGAPGGAWTPPPGQAYGGPPPGAGPGQTNGLAIGALVVGIIALLSAFIPFVGIFAIVPGLVALVLGIIGLRKAGQLGSGRGMAIAGTVLGVLAILGAIAWIVFTVFLSQAAEGIDFEGEFGTTTSSLGVGDCYDDGDPSTAVSCDEPHQFEVFAEVGSDESCSGDAFEDFVGTDYGSSRYYTEDLQPADGGGQTLCALHLLDDGELTGSVEGAGD